LFIKTLDPDWEPDSDPYPDSLEMIPDLQNWVTSCGFETRHGNNDKPDFIYKKYRRWVRKNTQKTTA